jgi:hypothetical protein
MQISITVISHLQKYAFGSSGSRKLGRYQVAVINIYAFRKLETDLTPEFCLSLYFYDDIVWIKEGFWRPAQAICGSSCVDGTLRVTAETNGLFPSSKYTRSPIKLRWKNCVTICHSEG